LRELYLLLIDKLPRLEKGLNFIPQDKHHYKDFFDIIIAVHEIETWFLAETNHFVRVDKRLTGRYIEKHLGFNPYLINPLARVHPSLDLNRIYKLAGKSYTKKYYQVEKLVNKLDFNNIRRNVRHKIPSLNALITQIERFKKNKLSHANKNS